MYAAYCYQDNSCKHARTIFDPILDFLTFSVSANFSKTILKFITKHSFWGTLSRISNIMGKKKKTIVEKRSFSIMHINFELLIY